jgi:hypothetical protein
MHGGARMNSELIDASIVDTNTIDAGLIDHSLFGRESAKPTREQFVVGPYQVQHLPTGAKFGAYPGHLDLCYINWGALGELCAAPDYCDALKQIARQLLRERPKF